MSYLSLVTPHIGYYDSLVLVTNKVRQIYHAVFKKARHEKITCKRLNPFLWYVARKAEGHGEYLVRFHEAADGQIYVSCNSAHTGERCKGTIRQKRHFQNPMCVHEATAIDRSIQYGQRKQRIESERVA